jgi:hypothetical protein
MEIHVEARIEGVWRFALRGNYHANFWAGIQRVYRYTLRPSSSECGDALGGDNQV